MSGEGDKKPYGNSDGKVEDTELKKYLDDTMMYYARRCYGRGQTAQIVCERKGTLPHQLTSILPHFLSSSRNETTAVSSDGFCTPVVVLNRGVECQLAE